MSQSKRPGSSLRARLARWTKPEPVGIPALLAEAELPVLIAELARRCDAGVIALQQGTTHYESVRGSRVLAVGLAGLLLEHAVRTARQAQTPRAAPDCGGTAPTPAPPMPPRSPVPGGAST